MAGFILSQQRTTVEACTDIPGIGSLDTEAEASDHYLLKIETTYQIRRPMLVRFLVRLGLDSVEADDVTQEAFLRAVDSSQSGEAPHNLFNWLLACAKNLALNRLRHQKYEMLAPVDLWRKWESELLDPKATPDVDLLRKERHRHFIEAVATLSAVEQQCILLRFQEVPFQDIADALKIPVHSAVYYAGTGIQKLQGKLKRKSL